MKKSLAVVLSFLMLLNINISVLGAISAEAEKDVVVTQDENPLPDENQEPENWEFSEESEEMSIEEESEKDITENNTQSEEDVTDAEESETETDSEEKEAVDSEGKSEPKESVSEPSEELNDESDSKNEADPKADNAEIDKTAEDGKDAEEFEEDEEISREDVEEDKTDEDAEGTEDAKLLASGNAVYYGEYGVWFDSVTHTITKGANRTSITIPSEIDGYIVSTIADYAFQNCYWLKSIDIPFSIDPGLVRGLDYYTRTVFEFPSKRFGFALGGGGRYDGLVASLGGPDLPGIGFGMGLTRVILAMKEKGLADLSAPAPKVYIASLGARATIRAAAIVERLRRSGVYAECDLVGRSLKSQMKYADKIHAAYTLILGDSEIDSGRANLRNMADGTQTEVDIDNFDFH